MAGIGGRTIAEAQERISYNEFMIWAKYLNKRGSLNTGMRIEESVAMMAALYANSKRTKGQPFTLRDFAPHMDEPVVDLRTAMESWR